ncbi:MAG: sulfite exporter TauE/SafE family protein [Pseudomonadota bacterium]
MEFWQIGLLALVGIVAGWLNVMAGGGSLLTVPIMLFMGIPGTIANGTNRVAILAQNIIAVGTFFQRGFSDLRLSCSLAAAAAVGAVAGAHVGLQLDEVWFNRILAAVMIVVMIIMATGGLSKDRQAGGERPQHLVLGHVLMVGAGFWGGVMHIGVGFILMPILHRVMGLNLVLTNVHKVFVVLVYIPITLWIFAAHLELLWWVGLGLGVGNALGGWLGARTVIAQGEVWIRRIMFAALSVFIVKLLFFS